MATIINTTQPAPGDGGNNTAPLVVGILLIVVILIALAGYGSGYFRRTGAATPSNTTPGDSQAPTQAPIIINNQASDTSAPPAPPASPAPPVNSPNKIDINVNPSQQ